MPFDFDAPIQRRDTDSIKWALYGADILPMWVADMDFASPPPIVEALQTRVAQGVFGYGSDPAPLRAALVERMHRLYNWTILPEHIVFLPGLVSGLNVVTRAIGEPGDAVLVNTPVYPPFLTAPINQRRELQCASLGLALQDAYLHYAVDAQALAGAVQPDHALVYTLQSAQPGRPRLHAGRVAADCVALRKTQYCDLFR